MLKNFFLFLVVLICTLTILSGQTNTTLQTANTQYGYIENKGQVVDLNYAPNPSVLYLLNTPGLNVQLRENGFSYDIYDAAKTEGKRLNKAPFGNNTIAENIDYNFRRVDIDFIGINKATKINPKHQQKGYINYYTSGLPSQGIINVPHYGEVLYTGVYDNIDVQFLLENGKPKYNFILHPGADISDIKLNIKNANEVVLLENGEIEIKTTLGSIIETIPECYYLNGEKAEIKFIKLTENSVGFFGEYNTKETLVIDPSPLRKWGTFFGGSGNDQVTRIASDGLGSIYFCGITNSTTNIASSGHQNYLAGNYDAFLGKFTAKDGLLLWSTYYGGTKTGAGEDRAEGISVDAAGNIYMAGNTSSPNNIGFNGFRDTLKGVLDAFLVKFDSTGVRLWGTYYGGNENEYGRGVSADKLGNVYLVGSTYSASLISFNGQQNTFSSSASVPDGFVIKFDSSGNRVWGTYYGGSDWDEIYDVSTDVNNNIIITGYTISTSMIYLNGHQNFHGGSADAIVAKYNPSGTLLWSTFYGGSQSEVGYSVITADDSTIYVGGETASSNNIASNGWKNSYGSGGDVFMVKFAYNGTRVWGTYYGGSGIEKSPRIAIDSVGYIYLCGSSSSTSGIAYNGYQNSLSGSNTYDAFAAKFDENCDLQWASYYGGTSHDYCYAAFARNEDIYLGGMTQSTSQIASSGAYQTSSLGSQEGYIVKFTNIDVEINSPSGPFCPNDTVEVLFTLKGDYQMSGNSAFVLELSNSSGTFDAGTKNLGQLITPLSSGKITGIMPAGLPLSTNYRVRVTSAAPAVKGTPSDSFTVNTSPSANFLTNSSSSLNPSALCLKYNSFRFLNTSTGTGTLFYHFDFGDGDSSDFPTTAITKSYSLAGTYAASLTVWGTNYNCSQTRTVTITVLPSPTSSFDVSDDKICVNDTVFFTNKSTTPSGTITVYNWSFSSNQPNPFFKFTGAQNYNSRLVVTNSLGCRDTSFRMIEITPLPSANFNINYISQCFNNNLVEFVNSSTITKGTMSYEWLFGDGDTSTAVAPVKSTKKLGLQTVKLTAISDNNCVQSTSKSITINPNPTAKYTVNDSDQCPQGNQFVFANSSVFPVGQTGTFAWLVGPFASTQANPGFTFAAPGTYNARLIVTLANGCKDTATSKITLLQDSPAPFISGPSSGTGKHTAIYSVQNTPGSTFNWAVVGGTIESGQGTAQITVKWVENGGFTGRISVYETNSNGCSSNPTSVTVSLSPSAINGIENTNNINLYPNPANSELNINIGDYARQYSITIFNNLGQVVLTKVNLTDNYVLSLNEFSNGVYLVKIEGDNFNYQQKLAVQKN